MDSFVLLTPVVVLAVILLLGFTGCDQLFGLNHIDPIPPEATLTFKVRVPAYLTVTLGRFVWIRPGSTVMESTAMLTRTDEGPDTYVLSNVIGGVVAGSWKVTCRLRVQDATKQGEDDDTHDFVLSPSPGSNSTVMFETMGRPDNNDFRIVAIGLIQE